VPAKRPGRETVSPLYASLGPQGSALARVFGGDTGQAQRIRGDWEQWHHRYATAWLAGEPSPPPPHAERFDTYARSG
jgi:hypothetical protein